LTKMSIRLAQLRSDSSFWGRLSDIYGLSAVSASIDPAHGHTSHMRNGFGQREHLNVVGLQHIRLFSCDAFRQAPNMDDHTVVWRKHDSVVRG
jgi:hypothetical protein